MSAYFIYKYVYVNPLDVLTPGRAAKINNKTSLLNLFLPFKGLNVFQGNLLSLPRDFFLRTRKGEAIRELATERGRKRREGRPKPTAL
jgi:hypothetical protein